MAKNQETAIVLRDMIVARVRPNANKNTSFEAGAIIDAWRAERNKYQQTTITIHEATMLIDSALRIIEQQQRQIALLEQMMTE